MAPEWNTCVGLTPLLSCFLIVILFLFIIISKSGAPNLPGPIGYPFLGHITLLGESPHETMTNWSRQFGDVYQVRFGLWPVVVINGYRLVHEALVRLGDSFADRPPFKTYKDYADGASMSFHPYDSSLRSHRRITSAALKNCALGPGKTDATEEIIWREGLQLVNRLLEKKEPFDPSTDITLAIAGILYSLCFGHDKLMADDIDYTNILISNNPTTEQFAAGQHVDFFPWRKFLQSKSLHEKNVERMRRMTALNKGKYEEMKTSDDFGCIMGYMIEESKKSSKLGISRDQLLNTTVEFLSAGTETSSNTLLWSIIFMAQYPDIQSRVRQEIMQNMSADHLPTVTDRVRLPYTEATLMEVMRLSTIVPFALPHCAVRDVVLAGHRIPQGTLVYMNLWSVARDPQYFEDADQFNPDRFLVDHGDALELNYDALKKQLPFGAGKRKCIGETLGKAQVFILFTLILQKCRISFDSNNKLPLNPNFGDILKPKPFDIIITPL